MIITVSGVLEVFLVLPTVMAMLLEGLVLVVLEGLQVVVVRKVFVVLSGVFDVY